MLGFAIGAVSGAIQFWLLSKFTRAVSRGVVNAKVMLFALSQFLFPMAVLSCCAIFLSQSLVWTGTGIAASLIGGAVLWFFVFSKSAKGGKTGAGNNGKRAKR